MNSESNMQTLSLPEHTNRSYLERLNEDQDSVNYLFSSSRKIENESRSYRAKEALLALLRPGTFCAVACILIAG